MYRGHLKTFDVSYTPEHVLANLAYRTMGSEHPCGEVLPLIQFLVVAGQSSWLHRDWAFC